MRVIKTFITQNTRPKGMSCVERRVVWYSPSAARLSPSLGAGWDGGSHAPIAKAENRQRRRRARVKARRGKSRTDYFAVFRVNESVRACSGSEPAKETNSPTRLGSARLSRPAVRAFQRWSHRTYIVKICLMHHFWSIRLGYSFPSMFDVNVNSNLNSVKFDLISRAS